MQSKFNLSGKMSIKLMTIALLTFAWPIFTEQFLRVLMTNIDIFQLSFYSDKAATAAGVANQIIVLTIYIYGFVSVGLQILVSQLLGAKRGKEIEHVITTGLVLAAILGIILTVVFLFFSSHFLSWLGLDDNLIALGTPFLQWIGGASIVIAIQVAILPILRSHGYVKQAMYVPVVTSILNVIGNYLFLFGPFGIPVLGMAGVGIATALANFVGLLLALYLLKRHVGYTFSFKKVKDVTYKLSYAILRLGLPSSGESISYNGSQIIITTIVAVLGSTALTTKVYVSSISQFVILLPISIGQATQILIGHQVGARNPDQAYRQGWHGWIIGTALALIGSFLLYIFSTPIMSFFTNDPEVIELSKNLFLLGLVLETVRATNIILINSLNATGDVRFPLIVGLIIMWIVSLPFAYLLSVPLHIGLAGIWIAYIIDEGLRGGLMAYRWRSKVWALKSIL
ncbi:MATE family efflux transporter [Brochothrix thermosphacta]|nr:Multi antimicrobial extrusion protein (Na(+)/drug antiporter), MATE family of MDR efflux pumps [Brachybacterium faecium]SPN70885.1 putative Na+driven efflux transporter [Brochothrix thermosphacta]SPN74827.1 putative Na+driven efflux transporter [Brochothrix thermosphacta]SPP27798.1 putative Na+driven efflux transporter [Brochothrix thermosphacta]SPP28536.1 putative Na+driven efflux transporter [Brochothrix thermosphacta]